MQKKCILQLSKYGKSGIESGILSTTASPCDLCSKKAYQLGTRKIYHIDP
jgi:deoxycytidylate deaminase